ncbi:unnamed protein product [Soboliphyme baturini]|uniref:Apple domain-containing protein n=1 Tax=Soboliphyme baturini TaxID=241478 RepID=A0A183ICA2_9BILA|nr:unnamed protein product [Soboliphyme baturini]
MTFCTVAALKLRTMYLGYPIVLLTVLAMGKMFLFRLSILITKNLSFSCQFPWRHDRLPDLESLLKSGSLFDKCARFCKAACRFKAFIEECRGELKFKYLPMSLASDLVSYMKTEAVDERQCVKYCYERLSYCTSVIFMAPDSCQFSYWQTEVCRNLAYGNAASGSDRKRIGCITCSEDSHTENVIIEEAIDAAPKKLSDTQPIPATEVNSKQASLHGEKKNFPVSASASNQSLTNERKNPDTETVKSKFLECKNLTYSFRPTLLRHIPPVISVLEDAKSIHQCAESCYMTQFCISAIFEMDSGRCFHSYKKHACVHSSMPVGYSGAVAIGCLQCDN